MTLVSGTRLGPYEILNHIVSTRIGSHQPMTVIVNWPSTLPR